MGLAQNMGGWSKGARQTVGGFVAGSILGCRLIPVAVLNYIIKT
jgi:hypothetical protein